MYIGLLCHANYIAWALAPIVRLGWHIIYNSATQPEVSIQPITQDGFMGWPCKEAQSGSIVTIYTCMGLPTMYNSVSSGAILALRHFRYSRIWSADNINYAQFSSFVSQQHAWMKVHWMVVSSSWRRRWWIFVGVLRNSSFNLKKLLLCMTQCMVKDEGGRSVHVMVGRPGH